MTPERIKELRAVIASAADTPEKQDRIAMLYAHARNVLPSAIDTIEAQQRRIEELEAALHPFKVAADLDLKDSHADTDFVAVIVTARELRAACAALQPKEPS